MEKHTEQIKLATEPTKLCTLEENKKLKLFIGYSHQDELYIDEFKKHMLHSKIMVY